MNARSARARIRAVLSASEWEARLSAHYLRSDGPLGGAPIEYMDGTPAEIAIAAGLDNMSDVQAQAAFLSQFDRSHVQVWLDGRTGPSRWDGELPGYFRYLVLTCLVSATEEGAGTTHDFRIRLGQLIDGGEPLHAVSGVNDLWQALAAWCERRRALGEPIRSVRLPAAGTMKLIGHAVRIAFPSWRDRKSLTGILERLAPAARRSPRRLVAELSRPQHASRLSGALLSAFREFALLVREGTPNVASHRLWKLVESIDERLDVGGVATSSRWRIEVRFSGWEDDLLSVRVLDRARGRERTFWEGPLESLMSADRALLPAAVARCLDSGVLLLGEAAGAVWSLDDVGPALGGAVIVLRKENSRATGWPLQTKWRRVANDWLVSEKLDPEQLVGLASTLGLSTSSADRACDFGFEGGVAIGRASWLGRPGFMPGVRGISDVPLAITPIPPAAPLQVSIGGPLRFVASEPLTGRWRVAIGEGRSKIDKVLTLEADAPERDVWPKDPDSHEEECELSVIGERPDRTSPSLADAGYDPMRTSDLVEAVYCGARNGWAEGELVELVKGQLPRAPLVWDVLRAYAEAGFMEPRQAKRWGVRKWMLLPPSVVAIGPARALIDGALGAAARLRLLGEVRELGAVVIAKRNDAWTPDMLIVEGAAPGAVAERMGWNVAAASRPVAAPAPACWPPEKRTGEGRLQAGVWSFERGLFVERLQAGEVNSVRLERLVRERRDDRDLYRIVDGAGVMTTTSRTVAILEAHRRARRPLFAWRDGEFRRIARNGHLPLSIARALRIGSLTAAGPMVQPDGTWAYRYPAEPQQQRWVSEILGDVVSGAVSRRNPTSLDQIVLRRRRGARPSWWTPEIGPFHSRLYE